MARAKRPTGDSATNARKRYYRSAERYLKQAANSTGAVAARYRELARQKLDDALSTYSKKTTQAFSKPIQRIASVLGVDLQAQREKTKTSSSASIETRRMKKIAESSGSLASAEMPEDERREQEARAILNSPIGKRIIGGTVDIWRDDATVQGRDGQYTVDKTKILPSLFQHYEVDNLADLLEAIENEVGTTLYADPNSEEMYETVKLMLQIDNITGSNAVIA